MDSVRRRRVGLCEDALLAAAPAVPRPAVPTPSDGVPLIGARVKEQPAKCNRKTGVYSSGFCARARLTAARRSLPPTAAASGQAIRGCRCASEAACGVADQCGEALERVLAIALLRTETARGDHHDTIPRQPAAGELLQARLDGVRQRQGEACVEAELGGGRDLVDILTPRAARLDEGDALALGHQAQFRERCR